MRCVAAFLVSVLLLGVDLPATAGERVEICHFAPGGSGAKSITVSTQSAERHMIEHADHMGSCLVGAIPLSKVYVTSLSANDVIVFNGDTYTQIDTLATKKTPYKAFATPNGEYVFIPNFNSSSVSVVATADDTVADVVSVGGGPLNVVFSPDSTTAYVYNSRVNSVSVLRISDLTVIDTIAVGSGSSFVNYDNLAISPDGAFVYVPNTLDNTVSVIETASNQVLTTIPVGDIPLSVAVTPDSQYVYVVNGNAPVSVIRTSDHTVIAHVGNASLGWESIAITPDGQFVCTVGNSQYVQVISTATNTVVTRIEMNQSNFSTDIVISPDSSYAYVPGAQTSIGNGAVFVIEIASHSVVARIPIGGTTRYAATSSDGTRMYVTNLDSLNVIQTSDNSLLSKVNTGSGSDTSGIAVVGFP